MRKKFYWLTIGLLWTAMLLHGCGDPVPAGWIEQDGITYYYLEDGTPAQVFHNPQHPRLQDFLKKVL